MAQVIVTESSLQNIAGAIRGKLGTQDTYTPSEMAGAINQIHGDPVLEELTTNANGTFTPSSGKDGFSRAVVNVPNTYSASDNGKVVQNGALVAQSSQSITQNGTYDTTLKNQAIVNVPNSYSASDEGKVVDNGALVAQSSQTITQNGTYDTALKNRVTVNVSGGGGGGATILSGTEAPTASVGSDGDIYLELANLISDVSSFTKLYSQAGNQSYGNYGAKVNARLAITDESNHTSLMQQGWNASGAAYYDSENKIGAYAGYSFGDALRLTKIKLWLGRYSGQNNNLIATVEYMDANDEWHEVEDLTIATNLPYPLNVFEVTLDNTIDMYGIRWIHKKTPQKTGGNNICFFGMTMYGDDAKQICDSFLKVDGTWQPLIGSSIDDVNT